MMGRFLLLSAFLIGFGTVAVANAPCPEDSAAIVQAFNAVEPWIGQQLEALQETSDIQQVHAVAKELSQRTDSLTCQFKQIFPDDDDGMALFGMYSGLASAFSCSAPGLAAVYRASAVMALYSSDPPYRPAPFEVLSRIADHASALAHAKRPERISRLIAKLQADHVDLVVAL